MIHKLLNNNKILPLNRIETVYFNACGYLGKSSNIISFATPESSSSDITTYLLDDVTFTMLYDTQEVGILYTKEQLKMQINQIHLVTCMGDYCKRYNVMHPDDFRHGLFQSFEFYGIELNIDADSIIDGIFNTK